MPTPFQRMMPSLRASGGPLQSLELSCSLRCQRAVLAELGLALIPPPVELAPDVQNTVALGDHTVAQLLDILDQGAILLACEIEVLVPAEQITEPFGRKQHLKCVQLAPLVDVNQAAFQHRSPLRQIILS